MRIVYLFIGGSRKDLHLAQRGRRVRGEARRERREHVQIVARRGAGQVDHRGSGHGGRPSEEGMRCAVRARTSVQKSKVQTQKPKGRRRRRGGGDAARSRGAPDFDSLLFAEPSDVFRCFERRQTSRMSFDSHRSGALSRDAPVRPHAALSPSNADDAVIPGSARTPDELALQVWRAL